MVDRLDERCVESRGVMVCICAASVCMASSVGPGRMPQFADVTLRVALWVETSAHVPHAIGDKLDVYVYDYDMRLSSAGADPSERIAPRVSPLQGEGLRRCGRRF